MGDQQHGAAFIGQLAYHPQHLAHPFRVQSGGGFVEQHHRWPGGQRAGNGHPLLLAAGQKAG